MGKQFRKAKEIGISPINSNRVCTRVACWLCTLQAPEPARKDAATWLKTLGDVFVRLIRIVILPLIFFTIAAAVASIASLCKLGLILTWMLILHVLTPVHTGLIVSSAVIASITTAAIPGSGVVMLAYVLGVVGLPFEGIGIMLVIDPISDAIRTAINVSGDNACTILISRFLGYKLEPAK